MTTALKDMNLKLLIKDVEMCNKYFSNHVGKHGEDMLRKGILLLQLAIVLAILVV